MNASTWNEFNPLWIGKEVVLGKEIAIIINNNKSNSGSSGSSHCRDDHERCARVRERARRGESLRPPPRRLRCVVSLMFSMMGDRHDGALEQRLAVHRHVNVRFDSSVLLPSELGEWMPRRNQGG